MDGGAGGFDLVVRGRRVVAGGRVGPAEVGVRGGRIGAVVALGTALVGRRVLELAGDEVLLPGVVDTHVHVNEPGRTEWEGFATATAAAALGGVTCLLDMPLNSVPATVDVAALGLKRAAARGRCRVDVGFWGGAVPENLGRLAELHRAGVFGFKCFLLDSGVAEFPALSGTQLAAAGAEVAGFDGLLLAHAEAAERISAAPTGGGYAGFLASRPAVAEELAVSRLIEVAGRCGARVHVVHVAAAGVVERLAAARAAGVRVSAETCPHYLFFDAGQVPFGATEYKCCPPIRSLEHQGALWQGLRDGVIDCVVSDHSPCLPELKRRDEEDFAAAWGGVASLQLGLSVVWTAARQRGVGLARVARWMASGPAELVGLGRKGRIAPGCDADLVVFAPEEEFVVDPGALAHRHALTPYAGRRLVGRVRQTWLRGRRIAAAGGVEGDPVGVLLKGGGA